MTRQALQARAIAKHVHASHGDCYVVIDESWRALSFLGTEWSMHSLTTRFPQCTKFQWSGDLELITRLSARAKRTAGDASDADFYVVPFLAKCYFNHVAKYRLDGMDAAVRRVLSFLHQSGPWWKRFPERHLFFFMSGIGAGMVPSWRTLLGRSIFLVAEGDREVCRLCIAHEMAPPPVERTYYEHE